MSKVDNIAALANFRDLGGLRTESGGRTRHGVLYRSDLPLAAEHVPAGCVAWPPRTVIDLRSPSEHGERPHALAAPDTVVRRMSVAADTRRTGVAARRRWSTGNLSGFFTDLYLEWLTERGEVLAGAVAAVMSSPGPALVHCAAGRDRTGVVVALLLRAAGVLVEEVVTDYRRTEANVTRVLRRLIDVGALRVRAFGDADFVTPAAIRAVVDHVDATPGGARGWLAARGVPVEDIDGWVGRFVGR